MRMMGRSDTQMPVPVSRMVSASISSRISSKSKYCRPGLCRNTPKSSRQRAPTQTCAHRVVVNQLQDERAARDDAAPAGKEVLADDVLENAAFAARLAADDGDLGHVEDVVAHDGEHFLDLVHDLDEALQAFAFFFGLRSRSRRRRSMIKQTTLAVIVHVFVCVFVFFCIVTRIVFLGVAITFRSR